MKRGGGVWPYVSTEEKTVGKGAGATESGGKPPHSKEPAGGRRYDKAEAEEAP